VSGCQWYAETSLRYLLKCRLKAEWQLWGLGTRDRGLGYGGL